MVTDAVRAQMNEVNAAVRDNADAKVILQADNIVVVKKEEVSPTFTTLAECDVNEDDVKDEEEEVTDP